MLQTKFRVSHLDFVEAGKRRTARKSARITNDKQSGVSIEMFLKARKTRPNGSMGKSRKLMK